MKIAILSDIHGNGYALQQVLGDAKSRGVDQYYFLGDYITDGPNVNSILNTIREIGSVVLVGNREEYIIEHDEMKDQYWNTSLQFQGYNYTYQRLKQDNLKYIKTLPLYKVVQVEGKKILLYHGIPSKARQVFEPSRHEEQARKFIEEFKCDIYIGGHTHIAFHQYVDKCLFINPGSVGIPMRVNGFSYGILHINEGEVLWEPIVIPYNTTQAIQSLSKHKEQYLSNVGIWSDLYFKSLQTNRDEVFGFLKDAYELADIKTTFGETKAIDNETFQQAVQLWKQKNALE